MSPWKFEFLSVTKLLMFFSSEFKPKKIKIENDKKAKKRKPDEVNKGHKQNASYICRFSLIFCKPQSNGAPENLGSL